MAEPFDTINAINTGPEHWWRFSVASGSVPDEGQATARVLNPEIGNSGAFNGTYQFDVNPFGDGFGIRFNGQGGLQAAGTGLTSARGTMFIVYRTVGNPTTEQAQFGFRVGSDQDYVDISSDDIGRIQYRIQDGPQNTDAELFFGGTGQNDSAVHSMAVSPGPNATTAPDVWMNGVTLSVTHAGDGALADNYWWDSFVELINVGMRGGVLDLEVSNMVAYEFLLWDTVLTAQQISDVHDVLTTLGPSALIKHQRRRGRRLFDAAAL